jgi:hypothetical protein
MPEVCVKCGKSLERQRSPYCSICRIKVNKEYADRYREAHREELSRKQSEYYKANFDTIKEKKKKYEKEHPEIKLKSYKKYVETHPERVEESHRNYREKNRELLRAKNLEWNRTHPEVVKRSRDKRMSRQDLTLGKADNRGDRWTIEDLRFIEDNIGTLSLDEIAINLGRTLFAVEGQIHLLKLDVE